MVLAIGIVLVAAVVPAGFHLIRARIAAIPVYREALAIACSSAELQDVLGRPIQEDWLPLGEVRHIYGSDFAEWTDTLKGSHGRGRLHGVANRIGSSWHYSRLLFISSDSGKTVDVTPSPERDKLPAVESNKRLFIVPLGTAQVENLAWAPPYYRAKFGLNVEVLPPIPLNASVWSARRHQLIAENLIALMKRALPEKVKDQSAVLIGVTAGDMYIQSYDWRYAINYREDGRFGVVSTARLRPVLFFQRWNQALATSRLQKMISKNVYLLCFDLPLSGDYTSAVTGGVMSPEEIDYMSDQVIGAEGRWHSQLTGVVPTISMVLAPEQPVVWNMDWSSKPPADVASEHFSANLGAGLLVQRKTDFYLDGDFPVQFVRVYASQDNTSREFGVGTNDSLDISLSGVPGKYLELTLENGVRTHFDHDASRDNARGQTYRGRADYFSPFSQASVFMQGFDSDLETTEGWHYFFPYHPNAKSEEKLTALTGYTDPQGRRFQMERNNDSDLLSITTPAGKWLHFENDERHRFRRIEDSEGRVLNYDYDPKGRLSRVSDKQGNAESYRYDDKNQMREVTDGNGHVLMNITYSPDGRITSQTLKDGRIFRYEYLKSPTGRVVQIQFTDPQDFVTTFMCVEQRYTQSLPFRRAGGQ
jgi:YD repeat-containing protein